MIEVKNYVLLPGYETNTWLVYDANSRQGILIDPAAPSDELLNQISELHLSISHIVNTHGHGDHIGGNSFFAEGLGALIAIHELDAPMLRDERRNFSIYFNTPIRSKAADQLLRDGDFISIGKHLLTVIHTPGHTPGGICLYHDRLLFSGDTLFEQSIGRTDLPGGSHDRIVQSIRHRLYILPDETVVYPGHGPKTSIRIEKRINPFVSGD
ncbi:MAG: MBL fold metallo-hydrolase [Candidatus Cloacimonetes bacterium]|nr:MBL fold metallo-hydrolase [Candidatus Cloacimonadota bacterium]